MPKYIEFHELVGVKKKDGSQLILENPPKALEFLKKTPYSHAAFDLLPVGSKVKFTVEFNSRLKSVKLIEDTVELWVDNDDTVEGWTNIAGVWFSPEETELFNVSHAVANNGSKAHNIMLTGDSGYGKTARAKAFAEHKNMTYVRINVALLRNEQDVFCSVGLEDNKTTLHLNKAAEAMQNGNAVVLLDEANRAHPNILNSMYSILDDERAATINTPAGNLTVEVGKGTLFTATVNLGYQFTGTFEMDSALRKRFGSFVKVGPPPMEVETRVLVDRIGISRDQAETIVLLLNNLRPNKNSNRLQDTDIDITTRKALQLAELCYAGMPLRQAVKVSLINSAPDETTIKQIMDQVNLLGV